MKQDQIRRMAQEAEGLSKHLLVVHARLSQVRITECRGAATVVLNGLGEIQDVQIEWVDQVVSDCLLAALRAAEGRAKAGYEQFGRARG